MLAPEFILSSMNTDQVLLLLVIDTRVLGCVADSLQERRFASISSTDYEDTKASIFRSEIIRGTHRRLAWGGGKAGHATLVAWIATGV